MNLSQRQGDADGGLARRLAQLQEAFAQDGPLNRHLAGYRPRSSQVEMAAAVLQAIAERGTLAAEAGTGTGKTLAYLVPALLSGGKVLISVATKALQDQVFEKDLPAVVQALDLKVQTALLKGRQNYVCHLRLERTLAEGTVASPAEAQALRRVQRFALQSDTGDRAAIEALPESASFWHQVSSTRENCLGSDCPRIDDCFVVRARRRAMAADVVVINHHLLLADMALRESTESELLPSADVLIIDEAHHIARTGAEFFGRHWSLLQVNHLAADALRIGLGCARDGAPWVELHRSIEQAVRQLRLACGEAGAMRSMRIEFARLQGSPAVGNALNGLAATLALLGEALGRNEGRDPELDLLRERNASMLATLSSWIEAAGQSGDESADAQSSVVRWLALSGSGAQFHETPLDCAASFAQARQRKDQAWILTSATLTAAGRFDPFLRDLGLANQTRSLRWESPFDYPNQALLYLPAPMPNPQAEDFPELVAETSWPLLRASQGRAFVLCSTLRAVVRVAERLRELIAFESEPIAVLEQGQLPRSQMLQRFRQGGASILVGSASFWEGIDVRGEALSVVVIDRLPFAPPDDPVVAARSRYLKAQGLNPFRDYQLPQAITQIRQGAGRLIRGDEDRGVLAILDERVLSRSYGASILDSLPPFTRTRSAELAQSFVTRPLSD